MTHDDEKNMQILTRNAETTNGSSTCKAQSLSVAPTPTKDAFGYFEKIKEKWKLQLNLFKLSAY